MKMRKTLIVGTAIVIALAITACTDTYLGRMLSLRGVDVEDYVHLPSRPVANEPDATPFAEARNGAWMTQALRGELAEPKAFDAFAEKNGTTAFIILADGKLVDERYYAGASRDSMFKSFSISKSVLSALFGIAAAEGMIDRDDRLGYHVTGLTNKALADVRLGQLLDNVSGFAYARGGMPWRQQPRMYYSTDIRRYLRQTEFAHPPGTKFEGEDLSPLLVGYALESALRKRNPKATLADFAAQRLWQPMGAEYRALWNIDRKGDGMEKVESGFVARAIDLARFGQLYLDNGQAHGKQIVPADWVAKSRTAPPDGVPNRFVDADGHYRNLWWGAPRRAGQTQRFYANGHFGQRIFVDPDKKLVIVRLGSDSGDVDWTAMLGKIADGW
jgi:CubicO group peptidase (beta-lactamase class C family)